MLPTFILHLSDELKKEHQVFLVGFSKNIWNYTKYGKRWISLGHNQRGVPFILRTIILLGKALGERPSSTLRALKQILKGSLNRRSLSEFNLRNALQIIQPDIIHIQWASHLTLFRSLLDQPTGKRPKIIVSLRGRLVNVSPNTDPAIAQLYREYFPKVDGFHAVSRAIAREAMRWGAAPEKIKVVYSGLDLQKISAFQKQDWRLGQPVRMLSVGRFHWKKGYHYALDALRLLRDKGHDIHYTLVASGASEEILYQIRDLGLEQYVEIIPGLPQQEVFQKMAEADLLLLPSVEEGIANVVLEAMAIGLPAVSSDCGGMGKVIEDRVNGLLFENRNVKNMADCIEALIRLSPAERAAMAEAARRRIAERHSLEGLGRNMVELYKNA